LNTSTGDGALWDVDDDGGVDVDGVVDVVATGVARLDNVPNRLV
jgi:hypothetical protein